MASDLISQRVKKVLNEGHLMSLGVSDKDGVWVSDVIFAADEDLNICWMSDPDARHSKAIVSNPQVAGTITMSNKSGEKNLGLQFSGRAQKVDGNDSEIAKLYFTKRGKPVPKEGEDVLGGDSWYMLVPDRIFLIDEEHFGYERKTFK